MQALARAMAAAGTVDNPVAIRAAFARVFPLLGDKFPNETFGLTQNGRVKQLGFVQVVKNGQLSQPLAYVWWAKTQKEFDQVKKATTLSIPLTWLKNSDTN